MSLTSFNIPELRIGRHLCGLSKNLAVHAGEIFHDNHSFVTRPGEIFVMYSAVLLGCNITFNMRRGNVKGKN